MISLVGYTVDVDVVEVMWALVANVRRSCRGLPSFMYLPCVVVDVAYCNFILCTNGFQLCSHCNRLIELAVSDELIMQISRNFIDCRRGRAGHCWTIENPRKCKRVVRGGRRLWEEEGNGRHGKSSSSFHFRLDL